MWRKGAARESRPPGRPPSPRGSEMPGISGADKFAAMIQAKKKGPKKPMPKKGAKPMPPMKGGKVGRGDAGALAGYLRG